MIYIKIFYGYKMQKLLNITTILMALIHYCVMQKKQIADFSAEYGIIFFKYKISVLKISDAYLDNLPYYQTGYYYFGEKHDTLQFIKENTWSQAFRVRRFFENKGITLP